jgi:PKD repeat protein
MKSKKIVAVWLAIMVVLFGTISVPVAGTVYLNPGHIDGTIMVTGETVTGGKADAYSIDPSGFDGHDYNAPDGGYHLTVEGGTQADPYTYWVTSEARMYDNTQFDDQVRDSYMSMGRQETPVIATQTALLDFSMIPGYIAPVVTVLGGSWVGDAPIARMNFYARTNYDYTEKTDYSARQYVTPKSGFYLDGTTSFPMKPWVSYDANGDGDYGDTTLGDTYLQTYGWIWISGTQYFLPYKFIDVAEGVSTNVEWILDLSNTISGSVAVTGETVSSYTFRGGATIDNTAVSFYKGFPGSSGYSVDVQAATWDIYPELYFPNPFSSVRSFLRLPADTVTVPPSMIYDWTVIPGYVTGNIDLYGAHGNLNDAWVYAATPSIVYNAYTHTYDFEDPTRDYRLILYPGDWQVGYPRTQLNFNYENSLGTSYLIVNDYRIRYMNTPTTVIAGEESIVDFSYGTATITINYEVVGGGLLSSPVVFASSSEGDYPDSIHSSARGQGSAVPTTVGEAIVTVLAGGHFVSAYATVEGSYTKFGELNIEVEPGDTWISDPDAPTVVVTQPEGFEHFCTSVDVAGTATDAIGVETITVNDVSVAFESTNNQEDPNEVSFSTTVVEGLEIGENTITIVATDEAGNSISVERIVIKDICNSPPEITKITGPSDPIAVEIPHEMTGFFTDSDEGDTHTAIWDWGDGHTSPGTVDQDNDIVTGSHNYEIPGVYTVTLTVTDAAGESDTEIWSQYSVIYDPSAGFVTGGGWIDSPEGAYTADPSLSGKANFGFVSRYKKGATVPTGITEFQFHAGDLNFHSDSYQWLVIAGAQAQFKGTGTINGEGSYKFMLTAVDGALNGGGGADKFRIQIWLEDEDTGEEHIIYDNLLIEISGGSIKIHKSKD